MKKSVGLFVLLGLSVCGTSLQAATNVASKDEAV